MKRRQDTDPTLLTGSSQTERLLKALLPDYVRLEERRLSDWLILLSRLSEHIQYYDQDNRPAGDWSATLKVNDEVGLTSSKDILQAMAAESCDLDVLVTLGYAGWDAGQLEQELADNAWLTTPADLSIVFDLPAEERFAAAMQLLGIDFANLSESAGHA